MEENAGKLKETVNTTLGLSFSEFNWAIDGFLTTIDKHSKVLTNCEKDVDKRYASFAKVVQEAEVCIAKE